MSNGKIIDANLVSIILRIDQNYRTVENNKITIII